jgi:hypothetical protein
LILRLTARLKPRPFKTICHYQEFVIPSEAKDLHFAANCRSFASLGMTIRYGCCSRTQLQGEAIQEREIARDERETAHHQQDAQCDQQASARYFHGVHVEFEAVVEL